MTEKHERRVKAKKEKLAKKSPNKKGKGGKTSKERAATVKDNKVGGHYHEGHSEDRYV